MGTVQRVLELYREKCFDPNVRHFHEKRREREGSELSYTRVKLALPGPELVKQQRKGGWPSAAAPSRRCRARIRSRSSPRGMRA